MPELTPSVPPGAADLANPLELVNFGSRRVFLDDLSTRMNAREGFSVATLNLDHIVKMRHDAGFAAAYRQHSHVVADGNPIVWLSRLAGRRIDLIPGSELIEPLVAIAAAQNVPIAMLGATQDTLDLAAARLQESYPDLQVVALIAPPFGYAPHGAAADADLEQIARSGAGLCFLALGAPKQEKLAIRAAAVAPRCGFVSIGAGLDFIAGHQTRAPRWVRRLALEWFWRMCTNPGRLAKRYALCIAILPGLVLSSLRERLRGQPST